MLVVTDPSLSLVPKKVYLRKSEKRKLWSSLEGLNWFSFTSHSCLLIYPLFLNYMCWYSGMTPAWWTEVAPSGIWDSCSAGDWTEASHRESMHSSHSTLSTTQARLFMTNHLDCLVLILYQLVLLSLSVFFIWKNPKWSFCFLPHLFCSPESSLFISKKLLATKEIEDRPCCGQMVEYYIS